MSIQLGYFVPEFPGQTHIFFWREIERLEALGASVHIVSTRTPPQKITSHGWSDLAKARTIYLLGSKGFISIIQLISAVFHFGPLAWMRCFRSILKSDLSFSGRIELVLHAFFGARLSLVAKKGKWNHIHVHSCANAANIALFAKLLSDLPYSITLHGPLHDYGSNQVEKWTHAEFGIVITQKLFNEVRSQLGFIASRNLYIAPMGVNIDVFSRVHPYQPYDGDGPALLYCVGRLNPCKGHADLIEAVANLKERGINIQLTIAGEDELGGSGYHLFLQELIYRLGLAQEIKLIGAVSERVIRDGLLNSHVFALASLGEPLGVAIMEAMALEMPVVVTSGGGVKELVDHGKDGLLVSPENVEELANSLAEVLSEPTLALKLGRSSRQKIAAQFQDSRSAELLMKYVKN